MADRITAADLQNRCATINGMVNGDRTLRPWTRVPGGRTVATVGAFYIDGACGGVALYRIINEGGGVRDVFECGHVTKRDLYARMRAFCAGVEAVRVG